MKISRTRLHTALDKELDKLRVGRGGIHSQNGVIAFAVFIENGKMKPELKIMEQNNTSYTTTTKTKGDVEA